MKKEFWNTILVFGGLLMISWFIDLDKGESESSMYYIFIFILHGIGLWVISSAIDNKKDEQSE